MLLKHLCLISYSRYCYRKLKLARTCSGLFAKRGYSERKEAPDFAQFPVERIRNFSIIAHVDHGKSTLADRLLEHTGAIKPNSGNNQVLDKLQVERERGITVKAQTASLLYEYKNEQYLLNLIDTPGHVDFSNEVSCQGVILLVDSNDGVQAQTVANFYLAFGSDLIIIPVLNKIDLKNADPDRVTKQLESLFDMDPKEVLRVSAKLGLGMDSVLEAIVTRLPPPDVNREARFRAFLFDSSFDRYRGVLSMVLVKDGRLKVGENIQSCHTKKQYEVKSLSLLRPQEIEVNELVAGQIGLIGCNMRSSQEAHIGDTIHLSGQQVEALPGFSPIKPMVFAGVYPMDQSQQINLRNAIEKLTLNDSAVSVELDNRSDHYYYLKNQATMVCFASPALGQGWRLGFLGLLHLEVFSQRLQQEYGTEAILTAPSVIYKVKLQPTKQTMKDGKDVIFINNPAAWPEPQRIQECFEPMVMGTIITPAAYLGPVMSLCIERRGVQISASNIDNDRIMLQYELPLCEIVIDFHDVLKNISSGYASFDYEDRGYASTNVVKMSILLNGVAIEELSSIVHLSKAQTIGKSMALRLKDIIPRQLVNIAIQACIGSKVLARQDIKPFRKDVTQWLYGGDVTRRKKLLAQQAAGKKKMRMIANISVPRDTFIEVLKR
ncbi:hypothetical protein YQE_10395, partial [Dendroctonus ponderosae]